MSLISKCWKGSKLFTLVLFVLITFICAISSYLLFTHSGNKHVIEIVKKIEPRLSITLDSGSLFNNPIYSNVSWISPLITIQFSKLAYEFDWSCLLNKICIEKLQADDMVIILTLDENESEIVEVEVDSDPFTSVQIPIEIDLKSLILNNAHFSMPDIVAVDAKYWEIQAHAKKDDIKVINSFTDGLIVDLTNTQKQAQENTSSASDENSIHNFVQLNTLPSVLTLKDLPQIDIFFNLDINAIKIDDFALTKDEQSIVSVNTAEAVFTFFYTKLKVNSLKLDLPEVELDLDGEVDFSDKYPLSTTFSGKLKEIDFLQPKTLLASQQFSVKSYGDFSDLHTELQLSNKLSAQAKFRVDLFSENLPHDLALTWQKIRWPIDVDAQFTSQKGSLISQGKLNDYEVQVQGDYKIEGIPAGELTLDASGNLQNLDIGTLSVNTLNGILDLSGQLDWQDNIKWQGLLAIDNIDLVQLKTDYTGQFNGLIKQQLEIELLKNETPIWQFSIPEISIDGIFLERSFAINGEVNGDSKSGILLNNVLINNSDNKLSINGNISQINDLNIDLNIVDLSHLLLESSGKIFGIVNIKGPNEKINISTELKAESISYQQNTIQKIDLIAQSVISDQPKLTMQLQAENLFITEQDIDEISIKVNNIGRSKEGENHQIDLSIDSKLASTNIEIQIAQIKETWLSSISNAKLYFPHHQVTLQDPFDIVLGNEAVKLTPHCWLASSNSINNAGELCIEKINIAEAGEIAFTLESFLLSSLDPMLSKELNIHGALTANAKAKWDAEKKPEISVQVYSNDMKLNLNLDPQTNEIVTYPMENFLFELNTDKQKAEVTAIVSSKGLIEAKIQGQFLPYQEADNLKGQIDINVPDFSPFNVLIPTLEKLAGQLITKIDISGTLKEPIIFGKVNIIDATIVAVGSPVLINRFNSQVNIKNTTASIEGSFYTDEPVVEEVKTDENKILLIDDTFNIVDKSLKLITKPISRTNSKIEDIPGIANIVGQIDWHKELKGNLHFYANKMTINDYSQIDMLVSPDLKLIIAEHINLQGNILVDKGEISIKELPEGSVGVSDDIIVIDIEEKKGASDLPIAMDLRIDLGDRLHVEAIGLDTTLKGMLQINKAYNTDLTVRGEIKLIDGSYRALAQQLVLRKSRITFQGIPESPYISIEAIRDPTKIEDNVTAGVRVTGTPDQLELIIFSDPALSQQDALSYIMRGKSLANNSDNDSSSQVTSMLIDIGAGKSSNVMNDLGNKVGITGLTLDSSGSGDDQSVGVSGYIAPGIEVSYGVGVFESFTIFAIRYELFEKFYIELSSGIDQAVDAYYEFDLH
jgi:translocation and assembly module TamB